MLRRCALMLFVAIIALAPALLAELMRTIGPRTWTA
jgi:hypothetical protein